MSAKFFLDTNIFVYSFDSSEPQKQKKSQALIETALESHTGIISWQVVQEFLNVATRKFAVPMKPAESQKYLAAVLGPLCEVFPSVVLYDEALRLKEQTGFSFYDSLIVAAAHAAGCDILYSEDLSHGQKIGSLTVQNPFR